MDQDPRRELREAVQHAIDVAERLGERTLARGLRLYLVPVTPPGERIPDDLPEGTIPR